MPLSLLALAIALAGAESPAEPLLQPGLYAVLPDAHLLAAPASAPPGQAYQAHYEHALPATAKVRYALVARDPQARINKLVFLTDAAYRYDINSVDKLCPAYAFPGWNERSEAQPFCRTNIGSDASEAAFTWSDTAFSLRWQDQKRYLGTERIPAQRRPTPEEAGACAISDVCAPEAYGRSIHQYALTHYRDGFALQQPRPYVDLLYLPRAVTLHARQDVRSPGTPLPADSFVAVLDRTMEWYHVEQVGRGGERRLGWIDRDALATLHWVEQSARMPGFRFRLGFEPVQADDARMLLSAIEVIDAHSGKRVQVMRDFEADPISGDGDVLRLEDIDADDYPDIVVPGLSAGGGGAGTESVYQYSPAMRMFGIDPTPVEQ